MYGLIDTSIHIRKRPVTYDSLYCMKIWKNTSTIDAWITDFEVTKDPEEAQLVILGSRPIELEAFIQLKAIFKCGVGTDNVPFEQCSERGIRIGLPRAETANIIYDETACFAIYLIYRMLYSEVGELDKWEKSPRLPMNEKNLLVLGVGNIGSRVITQLKGKIQIDNYDMLHHRKSELTAKLQKADIVSIHLPLDSSTRHLLNAEHLSLLKDGCCIVNTARGPIVDEKALLHEIQRHRLKAAFDVFWQEPYHGPLKAYHPDRFFMTPHVASTNRRFLESLAGDFFAFVRTCSAD